MKRKIFFYTFTIILVLFLVIQKAKTEQQLSNYRYYSSYDYNKLSDIVEKEKAPILFIVDFSNSMNNDLQGFQKINLARNTLSQILPKIPVGIKTGLRIYGYRTGFTYLEGCLASKLSVPLENGNSDKILRSLYSTNAIGWSPITHSLKQAINNDFKGVTGKKHIILLSDGGENCDESPCSYVIELMKQRNDITIDVIAFDIQDIEANNQLRCTALMTSGKFLSANDPESLSDSLFDSIGISKNVRGNIKIPKQ